MYIPSRDKKSEDFAADVATDEVKPKKRKPRAHLSKKERAAWAEEEGRDPEPKLKHRKWKHKYGEYRGRKKKLGRPKIYHRKSKTGNEPIVGNAAALGTSRKVLPPSERHMEVIDNWFQNGRDKRRALIDAGYSDSVAASPGVIFKREDVQREILRREKKLARRYGVTEDKIIEEISKLAFTSMADFIKINPETGLPGLDLKNATHEQLSALTDLKATPAGIQFKLGEKLAALDKLARINGMFDDKVTVLGAEDAVARLQAGRARMNKRNSEDKGDE